MKVTKITLRLYGPETPGMEEDLRERISALLMDALTIHKQDAASAHTETLDPEDDDAPQPENPFQAQPVVEGDA